MNKPITLHPSCQPTTEFAYRDRGGKWVLGFPTRQAAIDAAVAAGITQVVSAAALPESPAYFARFTADAVLERMIEGLRRGEQDGHLVGTVPAVTSLTRILEASGGNNIDVEAGPSSSWKIKIDLMNRLGESVLEWIKENGVDFSEPKCIPVGTEELHVVGTALNVRML